MQIIMSFSRHLEQTFLLEEIGDENDNIRLDSSKLVREVKKYPILYDNNLRRDQKSIFMAWEDICNKMLPNFAFMTDNHKIAIRKRLRGRWSYMRSTLRRDLSNNNIDCHKRLDWIEEIKFLVPLLPSRPTRKQNLSINLRRRARYKFSSFKKSNQHKITSTITSARTSNNNYFLPSPIPESDTKTTEAISTTKSLSSLSDIIISCDSNSSDKSTILDLSSNTTEFEADEKPQNDLMVETFMSTFCSDSLLTSSIDPDQMFLLTLLQSYRLVRNEHKEALQNKFYAFLRD